MKHSAVLRDIDLVASKHGVDSLPQPRFVGKLQQQSERFIRDPVLGIVEIKSHGFNRQTLPAFAIIGKEFVQMHCF